MKATLTNYRQSPRKVRLVANAVKGKNVMQAEVELSYMPKRASDPIKKLIKSAVANATKDGIDAKNLVIKNIEVNQGLVMKRFMPRAMGVAKPIKKKMSHVTVALAEKSAEVKKVIKKVSKKSK
ncbi:MAG TPA: 50S ribosomal protein L22 [Candidatus Paceibacterota bacterium]|nr:50S ribosomal protein L22 [Candidatus Paceibacterota bacterium]